MLAERLHASLVELRLAARSESKDLVSPFRAYLEGIKDRQRLDLLAKRTAVALQNGLAGGRGELLTFCVRKLVSVQDDSYLEPLMPLLKHDRAAKPLTELVGYARDNRFFPQLLVEALKSERDEVVDTALRFAPNCWDQAKDPEVRKALRKVLETRSEQLKFHACFPLMHGYHDPDAIRHLLQQTQSNDRRRALTAVGWIGDACNYHRPATDELLKKLTPFLESSDNELRRAAAHSIGTYSGEKVVRALLPRLADSEKIIVQETANNLMNQRDKEMLRRLLEEAADKNENPTVKARAKELFRSLPAK